MGEPISVMIQRPGGRDLAADVFLPVGEALGAGVILLHGGGWMFGHRADMAPQARALAAAGFTCITAEYRLSGEAVWPAQLQDVTDIVAWAQGDAEKFHFTPARIALLGASAGGHLALMAAPQVAAVVAVCAPGELHLPPPEAGPNPIAALLGPSASPAAARAASPLTHVSAAYPPICLIGGGRDALVPIADLQAMASALDAAGVAVDLHIYHGHAHAFDLLPNMAETVQAEIALFLKRAVVDPQQYTRESETLNPFARPGLPPMPHPAPMPVGAA